jgi:mono/diheme cytochrome c family protein
MRPAARRTVWLWIVPLLALLGLAAGWAFVHSGVYDVSATVPHTRPVHRLLELAMHRSVQRHAAVVELPAAALQDPQRQLLGAACFRSHCVQCHGGPGVAQSPFAQGMQPVPGSLIGAARDWRPQELYWTVRYGIKMSGMPAWEFRLSEDELLGVVAFVSQRLPLLTPLQYRQLVEQVAAKTCGAPTATPASPLPQPQRVVAREPAAQGELALRQHACIACHRIPGVNGPDTDVGPPLQGFARRSLIAGRLPNTRDNLIRWIRAPQEIDPNTAMPTLGVSEHSAGQMADYLARLD